jgi:hypothetical protein
MSNTLAFDDSTKAGEDHPDKVLDLAFFKAHLSANVDSFNFASMESAAHR